MAVGQTTAEDPAPAVLIAAQERELRSRYGVGDTGPGLSPGTLCLTGTAELERVYVSPDARGHGIGRRLLDGAGRLALARRGHRRIRLETGTAQPEALSLDRRRDGPPIPCDGCVEDDPTAICLERTPTQSDRP